MNIPGFDLWLTTQPDPEDATCHCGAGHEDQHRLDCPDLDMDACTCGGCGAAFSTLRDDGLAPTKEQRDTYAETEGRLFWCDTCQEHVILEVPQFDAFAGPDAWDKGR